MIADQNESNEPNLVIEPEVNFCINPPTEQLMKFWSSDLIFTAPWGYSYQQSGIPWAKAYCIKATGKGKLIYHLFNSVRKDEAYFRGTLQPIRADLADILDKLLSRMNPNKEELDVLFSKTKLVRIHGQGLIELEKDQFIITKFKD